MAHRVPAAAAPVAFMAILALVLGLAAPLAADSCEDCGGAAPECCASSCTLCLCCGPGPFGIDASRPAGCVLVTLAPASGAAAPPAELLVPRDILHVPRLLAA